MDRWGISENMEILGGVSIDYLYIPTIK